ADLGRGVECTDHLAGAERACARPDRDPGAERRSRNLRRVRTYEAITWRTFPADVTTYNSPLSPSPNDVIWWPVSARRVSGAFTATALYGRVQIRPLHQSAKTYWPTKAVWVGP